MEEKRTKRKKNYRKMIMLKDERRGWSNKKYIYLNKSAVPAKETYEWRNKLWKSRNIEMMEITKYICKKTSLRGKYKWNQQERKSSVNCSLCLQLEEGAMLIKRNENISSSSNGDANDCDDDNNNDGDNDISNNEMGRERKEERGKGGGREGCYAREQRARARTGAGVSDITHKDSPKGNFLRRPRTHRCWRASALRHIIQSLKSDWCECCPKVTSIRRSSIKDTRQAHTHKQAFSLCA